MSEQTATVGVIVGVIVGVGLGVNVGVGVRTQKVQSSKSGASKYGPPGPENSINL